MSNAAHWTLDDAFVVLRRMESVVLELQFSIFKQLERVQPDVEHWTAAQEGAMLRELGRHILDGTPNTDLGTGDGCLPIVRRALAQTKNGYLEAMTLFNICYLFSTSPLLDDGFCVSLIGIPLTINGKRLDETPALDSSWVAAHLGGFRKDTL